MILDGNSAMSWHGAVATELGEQVNESTTWFATAGRIHNPLGDWAVDLCKVTETELSYQCVFQVRGGGTADHRIFVGLLCFFLGGKVLYNRLFNIFAFYAGGLALTLLGILLVVVKHPQVNTTFLWIGFVVLLVALVPLYGLVKDHDPSKPTS